MYNEIYTKILGIKSFIHYRRVILDAADANRGIFGDKRLKGKVQKKN